ncbi:MAG TPA: thermonuclease family protein [Steroidobacteraceae bacterium]|nr:thermonuclease family protein [Steroidobacteraceae bacterium]
MLLIALALLTASLGACADQRQLTGTVVWVADGDSFELADEYGERFEVRIAGIDAPEKGQAFADRSKRNLMRLIRDQEVRVDWYKLDRFDRYVGKVWVRPPDGTCRGAGCPKTLDVAMAQLTQGLAWYFDRFADEIPAEDRVRYADAEHEARARRAGLWRDGRPMPPWQWRDERRRDRN